MQLFLIGTRAFNFDALTHASFEQEGHQFYDVTQGSKFSEPTCVVSFGCDDTLCFYGVEAEQVWALIKLLSNFNQEQLNNSKNK